jgi:hypothetical protein
MHARTHARTHAHGNMQPAVLENIHIAQHRLPLYLGAAGKSPISLPCGARVLPPAGVCVCVCPSMHITTYYLRRGRSRGLGGFSVTA